MLTEHRFISFDETPIFTRCYRGEGAPKGIVLLIHGMGEHGGRYAPFAEYLEGLGLEVWVPDLRGFGLSGGKRVFVRHFSDFHEDLKALHGWVSRQRKDLPIIIVGHSFGGLLAASYLALNASSQGIQGMVLSSPIFGVAIPVPAWRHLLGLAAAGVIPAYSQPTGVKPEFLTHDTGVLNEYRKDPLIIHRISAGLYRELHVLMNRRDEIAGKISLPSFVLQAGEDLVVSREKTVRFYEKLKSGDKKLKIAEGLYHEILNETGRRDIYSEIGRWILDHISHR
ncbi:MAG: lysophospholipase [Candidatus Omnitrophica bacterium]|nr:lysophospholipase [Candidatus Omnitrophota bacterium]